LNPSLAHTSPNNKHPLFFLIQENHASNSKALSQQDHSALEIDGYKKLKAETYIANLIL
jgi:hypothetical protein